MAATAIRGGQIQDGTVQRLDLDVATAGKAVVARIVQGTGITLSSTGADSGTGDVTINASGGGGTPGGSNTQLQFNDSGAFGGDASMAWDKSTKSLHLVGANLATQTLIIDAPAASFIAGIRLRDSNATRYRSDLSVVANGGFTFNAYDDTGLVYKDIFLDGSIIHLRPNATAGTGLDINGSAVNLGSGFGLGFGSTTAPDTGLARNASGVLEVNNATAGSYRDLKLRTLLLNPGAAPTGVEGALYGNSTDHKIYYYNGTAFVDLTLVGTGTVTSFSAGDLAPLFTTTESTPTTTPALTFALSTAAANTVFGNNTGATAAPGFQSLVNAQLPATISSKTHDDTNTYTTKDGANFVLENATTITKKAQFDLSNITAANTRTVNVPDANSTLIQPDTGAANNFLTAVSAQGVISKAQPTFANLSGVATSLQRGEWVAASTSSQTPILAVDTYIAGSGCVVGAGNWAAGGQYRCRFEIVKTGASTAQFALNIRVGTGVVGDTLIIGGVLGYTQTGVIDTMMVDVCVNIRTVGASATSAGNVLLTHTAANSAGYGLTNVSVVAALGQVATFNSTTATTIGVSFNGGASHSGTVTCVQASYMQ